MIKHDFLEHLAHQLLTLRFNLLRNDLRLDGTVRDGHTKMLSLRLGSVGLFCFLKKEDAA